jgi:hypothetical protein
MTTSTIQAPLLNFVIADHHHHCGADRPKAVDSILNFQRGEPAQSRPINVRPFGDDRISTTGAPCQTGTK